MKIVFMGSPEYAVKILDELNKKYEIVAVYTQPDKPVGRKKIWRSTFVKMENIQTKKISTFKWKKLLVGLKLKEKEFNKNFLKR